jgi:hypothetical protein
MLQHSRASGGQKELPMINKLADEYLRLAYHGLRAKDKSFNAKLETEFRPPQWKKSISFNRTWAGDIEFDQQCILCR